MYVLMIGDLVGPEAVAYLVERLPGLRRDYDVDLVIDNAENCAFPQPGASCMAVVPRCAAALVRA
jgi:calcineurin-like phosphoesterase